MGNRKNNSVLYRRCWLIPICANARHRF